MVKAFTADGSVRYQQSFIPAYNCILVELKHSHYHDDQSPASPIFLIIS